MITQLKYGRRRLNVRLGGTLVARVYAPSEYLVRERADKVFGALKQQPVCDTQNHEDWGTLMVKAIVWAGLTSIVFFAGWFCCKWWGA